MSTNSMTHWYRQFWPWLLIALPSAAVVACLITIVLITRHPDREIGSVRDAAPVTPVLGRNSVVPPKE